MEMITDKITSGELKNGDQIPSERELAEMLSVSRLPLREALKALEAMNVIESRSGEGYVVLGLDIADLVKLLNGDAEEDVALCREMKCARKILEIGAAELACQTRTQEDIEKMDNSIRQMEHALKGEKPEEILRTSMAFHTSMVAAAHNSLLNRLLACLHNSLLAGRLNTLTTHPERYNSSPQEHQAILNAIIQQDAETATLLLNQHLYDVY